MPTFVLNDENAVNSYGFRVKNSGMSTARFDANPVMLDSHNNTTKGVMGNWTNRRVDGSKHLADSNFDMANPDAARLSGQVDRQFVKGASMGLAISTNPDSWQMGADGVLDLIKSELVEGSVCGVPSNPGSLCLYNQKGELLNDGDVKTTLLNLTANSGFRLPNTGAVNFSNITTVDDFERLTHNEKLDLVRNNPEQYKAIFTPGGYVPPVNTATFNFAAVVTIDDFEKLAEPLKMEFKSKHTTAYMSMFNMKAIPASSQLQVQLDYANDRLNTRFAGQPINYSALSVKTIDDFEKLNDAEKLNYKNNHSSLYNALFSIRAF